MTSSDSTTDKTISGFMWESGGSALYYLLNLLTFAALARLLEPYDFGVVAGATIVIGFANLFADLGMSRSIVQKKTLLNEDLATAFLASAALGVGLFLTSTAVAPAISDLFNIDELRNVIPVAASIFLFTGLSTIAQAMLQRDLRFRTLFVVRVSSDGILYAAASIALAVAGTGYWSIIIARLAASAVSSVSHMILGKHSKSLANFSVSSLGHITRFGGGISLARIISYFGREGDTMVVARAFPEAALGVYSRAYRLMAIPANLIGDSIDRVLFPVLSRMQGQRKRTVSALKTGIGATALLTLPVSVLVSVLSDEIVAIVLGPGWEQAVRPLQLLALGMYLRLGYKLGGAASIAQGVVYSYAALQMVYALVALGGAWLARGYGLEGVASAVLVALAVQFMAMWALAARATKTPLSAYLQAHIQALPATIITIVVSLAASHFARESELASALTVVVTVGSTLLILIGGCYLFPQVFLGSAGEWLVKEVRSRVNRFRHDEEQLHGATGQDS